VWGNPSGFESRAAHHPIHNANRGRGDPEGRDDLVPAVALDAGDELLKERFPLLEVAASHGLCDRLGGLADDQGGRRLRSAGVGLLEHLPPCPKVRESLRQRLDPSCETALPVARLFRRRAVPLDAGLRLADLGVDRVQFGF
jgi:hypothetical protein